MQRLLREVFQLTELRPGQAEVIQSLLAGRHTLAIMPTGAGKSLCYQLPALTLPGMTIVVSPLIALMTDQREKLDALGLPAAVVHSALRSAEATASREHVESGKAEFLLTTPEQLADAHILDDVRGRDVDLFVIDEAHCISQWGHDFRPSYLAIGDVLRHLGTPTVLALTATATSQVVDDIRERLGLDELHVINTGIYRSNLQYEVRHVDGDDEKIAAVIDVMRSGGGPGIIYAATIRHVEAVWRTLTGMGIRATRYHGRLSAPDRHDNQTRFSAADADVMVATNAFGMGIDKADLRYVIHYDLPGSLESYYQESGRAGRDGRTARCVLLYQSRDRGIHTYLAAGRYPRDDDFVHIATVLGLFGDAAAAEPLDLAAIQTMAGRIGKRKVRVILAALKQDGLIVQRRSARFGLKKNAGHEQILAVAARYDARTAADRTKLDRMVAYAQSARCRWLMLAEYFSESIGADSCGHCDICLGTAQRPVAAAAG